MENVRKNGDIKIVTTERKRNYLVSEPNYHTTKFFIENLLAIEMKKTEILMNKPVYLRLSMDYWIIRDELGGKIMIHFVGLRAKTYSYFIDDGSENKETKGSKKCVIKKP